MCFELHGFCPLICLCPSLDAEHLAFDFFTSPRRNRRGFKLFSLLARSNCSTCFLLPQLQDLGAEFGTERMKWAGDDEERDRIVYQTSRKYRSVLLSLLQAEEGRNPHGVSQHQSDESRLLQYVNSAWSLVELLYFDRASNITRQLRHWLQETCPSPCTDVSLSDKSFWPTVRRWVVKHESYRFWYHCFAFSS